MLDVGQKTVKVLTGDTVAILTGVQYWKGLYDVLRELNEEPARINAGIVVWKINAKETVG